MSALLHSLTGLTLASPAFLGLLLLPPAVLLLRLRRGGPAVLFPAAALIPRRQKAEARAAVPRSLRARLAPLPPFLAALGLLFVAFALARPVRAVTLPRERAGLDIMLCLDVSSSMAANDMDLKRSRLTIAKEAAARFIEGRPDDRIGLLAFARFPDLRCPLTLDHGALAQTLSGVEFVQNDGPEDATAIGTAVARAAQVLSGGEAKAKVVILLTDGAENVATADKPEEIAPLHAGQLCLALGVRVYAISVGLGDRDSAGEWVPLDTRSVRRLAERSGGRFYAARDAGAVNKVYGEIGALERVGFAEPKVRIDEMHAPFLVAAIGLLLIARFLATGWLRVAP